MRERRKRKNSERGTRKDKRKTSFLWMNYSRQEKWGPWKRKTWPTQITSLSFTSPFINNASNPSRKIPKLRASRPHISTWGNQFRTPELFTRGDKKGENGDRGQGQQGLVPCQLSFVPHFVTLLSNFYAKTQSVSIYVPIHSVDILLVWVGACEILNPFFTRGSTWHLTLFFKLKRVHCFYIFFCKYFAIPSHAPCPNLSTFSWARVW